MHARLSKPIGKFELMFTVQIIILEAKAFVKIRCYIIQKKNTEEEEEKKYIKSSLDFYSTLFTFGTLDCGYSAYKYRTTRHRMKKKHTQKPNEIK